MISLFCCFLNGEVQSVVQYHWTRWRCKWWEGNTMLLISHELWFTCYDWWKWIGTGDWNFILQQNVPYPGLSGSGFLVKIDNKFSWDVAIIFCLQSYQDFYMKELLLFRLRLLRFTENKSDQVPDVLLVVLLPKKKIMLYSFHGTKVIIQYSV